MNGGGDTHEGTAIPILDAIAAVADRLHRLHCGILMRVWTSLVMVANARNIAEPCFADRADTLARGNRLIVRVLPIRRDSL